jgi:uncharacterized repeat protein (TIGR01451 family)
VGQQVEVCAKGGIRRSILARGGVLAISLAGATLHADKASAQSFTCSGDVFQVQSGQLRIFDPTVSGYVNVGAPNGSYNATGFNVLDNFAYGMQGRDVIRIRGDGTIEDVFTNVTVFDGTSNVNVTSFAGDVDDNNTFWVRFGSSQNQLVSIDLATGATQLHTITGTVSAGADLMFYRDGGVPYLLYVHAGRISRINLNTFVSTRASVADLPGGSFGAQWTDFNGRIFAFRNTDGRFYEIFDPLGSNPSASLAGQGDPSGNNDGFSCPNAPFPNLPPVAQDDGFVTPFETALTRNILIDNGNGTDFDPESSTLTVQTTPVSGPSNGTVSLNASGSMTYTPNPGFYGTDTFVYRISDITGLTDTATVTITVPAPPIDLITRKTLASGTSNPSVGDTVTFLIEVINNGPAEATGVSLTDLIPTGLTPTVNNGNVTTGSYDPGSGVWTLGTIAQGATESLTIEGTVDAGQGGQPLENNTTKAVGDQTDPTDSGNDLGESLVIFPLTLAANDDNSPDIVSGAGSANALNVFDGDTLQNNPATPTNTFVSVAPGSSVPAGLIFNTVNGVVSVAPGTAPGVYSFDYQICETANATNCDIATATVTVIATPIDANNDEAFGIVGATGATAVLNAFSADTLDGAAANSTNTTLAVAPGSSVPAGLTFNTGNGDVDVDPGMPEGNYSFDYQLCETAKPSNCDIATITVEVIAAAITASDDSPAPLTGVSGNPNIGNAFANDTLNGSPVDAADITTVVTAQATPVSPGAPVPQLNTANGTISVPPNTPAGTYTIAYRICETINPMNCAPATITVTISPTADLSITKTNTPGLNGEVDQTDDTVISGSTTTYTLVVTNNGPDAVTGAVVNDSPGSGITCPPGNAVTITGSGVPTGSFTVANLTSGIALGTLADGESATLSFSCTVN